MWLTQFRVDYVRPTHFFYDKLRIPSGKSSTSRSCNLIKSHYLQTQPASLVSFHLPGVELFHEFP